MQSDYRASDYWTLGLSGLRLLSPRTIGPRTTEPSDYRALGLSGLGLPSPHTIRTPTTELLDYRVSDYRAIGLSGLLPSSRTIWSSDYWALKLSGPRTTEPLLCSSPPLIPRIQYSGLSIYRARGLPSPPMIGPRTTELSIYWTLGLLVPRNLGPEDHAICKTIQEYVITFVLRLIDSLTDFVVVVVVFVCFIDWLVDWLIEEGSKYDLLTLALKMIQACT